MSVKHDWDAQDYETGNDSRRSVRYVVDAAPDEDNAIAQLQAFRPSTLGSLVIDSDRMVERLGVDTWIVESNYELPANASLPDPERLDPPETGDSRYSFEFGLTNAHITHSKGTVDYQFLSGTDWTTHDQAIGVQGSGQDLRIEGVDVQVPVFTFSETHYLSVAVVTGTYKSTIGKVVGKVNDAGFKGFAAGEVMCSSITGSQRNNADWEITFSFSASENLTGLVIGSLPAIDKKGWEHLWVQYRKKVDTTNNVIKMQAVAVYVEKIYDTADFSTLGIGTS